MHERPAASAQGRRPLGLATVLVGVIAVAFAVWSRRPPSSPPTAAAPEVNAIDVATGRAGAAAPPSAYGAPAPREAAVAGVGVVLRDRDGQPLAGYQIALRDAAAERRPDEFPAVRQEARSLQEILQGSGRMLVTPTQQPGCTGADGRCEWRHPGAGTYRVELLDQPLIGETFELPADRGRVVELRLAPDLVAVRGQFVRGDVVQNDLTARVDLAGGGRTVAYPEGPAGDLNMVLPAGTHRLAAMSYHPGTMPGRREAALTWLVRGMSIDADGWVGFGERTLTVPADVARCEFRVEVDGCDVAIVARTPHGRSIGELEVDVDGTAASGATQIGYTLHTDGESRTRIERLPPGSYRVTVRGDLLAGGAGQDLRVLPGDRALVCAVQVAVAAVVHLDVRTATGRPLAVPGERLPPLLAGERSIACSGDGGGTIGPRTLRYRSVPEGPATLRCVDCDDAAGRHFLPFDPLPDQRIDVVAGDANALELYVEPRALVDLRACDACGREQPRAMVAVFAGDQQVAPLSAAVPSRWRSYLPPGDYRAVVERDGSVREHAFTVVRQDLNLRLRP